MATCRFGDALGWRVLHPQSRDSAGTDAYPSIRYGHSLASYNGTLVSTHGYYYDRERSNATWLSDTWALGISGEQARWQRLSDHMPQDEAYRAYSKGRDTRAPCGRFGFASAVIGDALLVHGGNDGGYSRTNRSDYRPGHDFDELWRFNLTTHSWRLLRPRPYGGGPGRRYLAAAAAVQGSFVLYGGSIAGQGDVWSYNVADDRWVQLAEEVPRKAGGPGRRMGHSLTPWVAGGNVGVVMYGGRSERPNGTSIVHRDAWFFDLGSRSWRKLTPAAAAASPPSTEMAPPARLYHAAMDTTVQLPTAAAAAAAAASASAIDSAAAAASAPPLQLGVVAGGTLTSPGLKCARDAWAFTLDCSATRIAWARLPDLPAAMYDTRGAAASGAAFLFGGHLCALDRPGSAEPYPYYYVNEVLLLDLDLDEQAAAAVAALQRASRVGVGADGACVAAARKEAKAAEGGSKVGGSGSGGGAGEARGREEL